MVLALLLTYCDQSNRDLSTPTSRMVGHWTTVGEYTVAGYAAYKDFLGRDWRQVEVKDTTPIELSDGIYQIHLYFGPIDETTNSGPFTYVVRNGDDIRIQGLFEYNIIEEQKDGTEIEISYWNNQGDTLEGGFIVGKKGKDMWHSSQSIPLSFNYIGDVQRFLIGVKGTPMCMQMIYNYVDSEIKPSELTGI